MALVVISVFEKLFDKNQAERSIKGKSRREALSEVAKHLVLTRAPNMRPNRVAYVRALEKLGAPVVLLNCGLWWKIPS